MDDGNILNAVKLEAERTICEDVYLNAGRREFKMSRHSKIGLFFLGGDYFWQSGVYDAKEGRFAGFAQAVESDVAAAIAELSKHYQVVTSGILHTKEEAVREAKLFQDENVDAIVYCPIIWTNDQPLLSFIQEAKRVPLIMWAYCPYHGLPEYMKAEEFLRASGPVSVQQSSNILHRFGWDYGVTFGNEKEEATICELKAFIKAALAAKGLKGTRIGVLPSSCRVVISSWIDEFYLLEKFGVELTYISVDAFDRMVKEVKESDAADYVRFLKSYPVFGADDDCLRASAKQALAMVRLAEEYQLSGIALEDFNDEIYKILKFRPHLYHPRLGELETYIGLEADVPGTLATIIVSRLAEKPGLFNELFTVNRYNNTFLMGHPGPLDLRFGDPSTYTVTRDLEFDSAPDCGAWISFRALAGPMTLLNLTPEYGKLKATAFTGDSLNVPRVLEGYAHMLLQPKGDAVQLYKKLVELGLMQHWGTVQGDVIPELRFLAKQLNLELNVF